LQFGLLLFNRLRGIGLVCIITDVFTPNVGIPCCIHSIMLLSGYFVAILVEGGSERTISVLDFGATFNAFLLLAVYILPLFP
jgi:hypothetical protein